MADSEAPTPTGLEEHLLRMRLTAVVFAATVPLAVVLCFVVPHRGSAAASPVAITLVAVAAALWVGFTANADARGRLERIRRHAAVHGDEVRLLREHWFVYLVVLTRLEVLVICGFVVAVWGLGPRVGVWVVLLGGLMFALTWPTTRKAQLLLGRVRAAREYGRDT